MILYQQVFVEDDFKRPPHGVDVVRIHRSVGLRKVDPKAHPLGHLFEGVDVSQDRLPAARVELGDTEGFDVGLAGEAKLLLDGKLDGQTVAVPTRLPWDVVALHGAVAREGILEHPGLDVMRAGHSIGGGWTFVEDPERSARGLLDRTLEDP